MKTLIVYYSRTGANRATATVLQTKINSDIEEIKEEADRDSPLGMIRGAIDTFMGKPAKIAAAEKSPGNYDLVTIVTPIWMGKMPPATAAYLKQHKDQMKAVAVLSVSGSGEKNIGFLSEFEKAAGKKATAALLLSAADIKDKDLGELIKPLLRKIL